MMFDNKITKSTSFATGWATADADKDPILVQVKLSDPEVPGSIGGVTLGQTYFLKVVDGSNVQLATTKANLDAGTYVDITAIDDYLTDGTPNTDARFTLVRLEPANITARVAANSALLASNFELPNKNLILEMTGPGVTVSASELEELTEGGASINLREYDLVVEGWTDQTGFGYGAGVNRYDASTVDRDFVLTRDDIVSGGFDASGLNLAVGDTVTYTPPAFVQISGATVKASVQTGISGSAAITICSADRASMASLQPGMHIYKVDTSQTSGYAHVHSIQALSMATGVITASANVALSQNDVLMFRNEFTRTHSLKVDTLTAAKHATLQTTGGNPAPLIASDGPHTFTVTSGASINGKGRLVLDVVGDAELSLAAARQFGKIKVGGTLTSTLEYLHQKEFSGDGDIVISTSEWNTGQFTSAVADGSNNNLVFAANHCLSTGDRVIYADNAVATVSGLVDKSEYYVVKTGNEKN